MIMKNSMLRWAAVAAAALLGGCAGAWNGAEDALSVAEEHPITVDSQVVTLTLDIDGAASGLSAVDKARVNAFASAYLSGGHGPVTVTAPAGANAAAQNYAAEARKSLNEAGVNWSAINGSSYIPSEGGPRQVLLTYVRYVATPSACGVWEGMKARDFANLRSPNFGCATQNNLAAMIADPRDLVQPADEAPADAPARIRGIKRYREGSKTSSETDPNIKTQVSSQ
jgi:pilus assembly protein CpaD